MEKTTSPIRTIVESLDWEKIKDDLCQQLAQRGIFTDYDARTKETKGELTKAVVQAVRKPLQEAYRNTSLSRPSFLFPKQRSPR